MIRNLSALLLCLLLSAAIFAAAAYTADDFNPLAQGCRGQEVKDLQLRLKELGFLSGRADGLYGAQTEQAVTDYAEANEAAYDGIVTPELQATLFGSGVVAKDGSTAEAYELPDRTERAQERIYIGNLNTKKFHTFKCRSLRYMKYSNRIELTYNEAIVGGYVRCKRCRPR